MDTKVNRKLREAGRQREGPPTKESCSDRDAPYTQPTVIYSIHYWVIAPSRGMAGPFFKKYLFPASIQIRAIFSKRPLGRFYQYYKCKHKIFSLL